MGLSYEERQIYELLNERRAYLARDNGHRTYKFPDGRTFTLPGSPSDQRWAFNSLSDLKKMLGVERVRRGPKEREDHVPEVKVELESDYSFVKDIQPGESLAVQLNQLRGERTMAMFRHAQIDDRCLTCNEHIYSNAEEVKWYNSQIDADPDGFKARTKCKACKEKINAAISTLPTKSMTYQVRPGVTLTKQVPVVPEVPEVQPLTATALGGGYAHGRTVYLKPSMIAKLRTMSVPVSKSDLSRLLEVSTTTIRAWGESGRLPKTAGHEKIDPSIAAEMLWTTHEHWCVEEGFPSPPQGRIAPVRPTPAVAPPVPAPVASTPATAAAARVATNGKLSDQDLLRMAAIVLEGDASPKAMERLVAEIRTRYGTADPTREMLRWLMAA